MKYGKSKVLIVTLWDLSGYSEKSNFQEIQFLKQGPAYKTELSYTFPFLLTPNRVTR